MKFLWMWKPSQCCPSTNDGPWATLTFLWRWSVECIHNTEKQRTLQITTTRKTMMRYNCSQKDRTLIHPTLPQPKNDNDDNAVEMKQSKPSHRFVVCADTQIGLKNACQEWESELVFSRQAIEMINELNPRPLFCCMCGDMVEMENSFYTGEGFTREECDQIQDEQNRDFQKTWEALHEDIALVCVCGNHGTF